MHKGLMQLDRATTRANNRATLGRGGPNRRQASGWASTLAPITSFLALQAEEGSMTARFATGISGLNALRDRVHTAVEGGRRRMALSEETHGRRLAGRPGVASRLYDELERRGRRRLEAGKPPPRVLELPDTHALSWVHDLVGDWHAVFDEGERLYAVTRRRLEARKAGHDHARVVRENPTGWSWLDTLKWTKPSAVGDAIRRVMHRKEPGTDPPWHHERMVHRIDRRLDIREPLAHDSPARLRRLGEALLEGTLAAPFAFVDTVLPSGTYVEQSEESFWKATLRYIVGSTVRP